MRIAFLVNQFPIISETFIVNLATGLIDRGHAVDIYAVKHEPPDQTMVHQDVLKYHLLERTFVFPERPVKRLQRVRQAVRLLVEARGRDAHLWLGALNIFRHGRRAGSLLSLFTVLPLLGRGPYDVVHCQFATTGLNALEARRLGALQGKLVVSARGYDVSQHVQIAGRQSYERLFAEADVFLPNCEFFAQRLRDLGCDPRKIEIFRSGLDSRRFPFATRHLRAGETVRLATVGRLVGKKGIEYVIRAVALLRQQGVPVELLIVGEGPLREALAKLAVELGVTEVVQFLGAKNQEQIIGILEAAHLFIGASITDADGNQDAPINTLKEAMAMGLPVVGTRHGGIPEMIEDGISGLLVPERDAEALAKTLRWLITRPEIWPEMGRAGRARVESAYDLQKLTDRLVDIYRA
jgi:colanic acid/amylovoran biosynthesis glycosyltransferase